MASRLAEFHWQNFNSGLERRKLQLVIFIIDSNRNDTVEEKLSVLIDCNDTVEEKLSVLVD